MLELKTSQPIICNLEDLNAGHQLEDESCFFSRNAALPPRDKTPQVGQIARSCLDLPNLRRSTCAHYSLPIPPYLTRHLPPCWPADNTSNPFFCLCMLPDTGHHCPLFNFNFPLSPLTSPAVVFITLQCVCRWFEQSHWSCMITASSRKDTETS